MYVFLLSWIFIHQVVDISLESLFICLSIDALFVRIVPLGRMQGEYIGGNVKKEKLQN